jgi:hypothetical protein
MDSDQWFPSQYSRYPDYPDEYPDSTPPPYRQPPTRPRYPDSTPPPYRQPPTRPRYPEEYPDSTPPPYRQPPTRPRYPEPQPQYPRTPYPQAPYYEPEYPQAPYYPYSQPLPPLPEKPRRSNRRTLWIVLGSIGAVLIVCCVISAIAVAANGGSVLSSIKATATAIDPNASAPTYAAAIIPQAKTLQADFNRVGKDCSANNMSACKSDLQQVERDAAHFQQVLNQNPAPPCFNNADTEMRKGLTDYQNGAALAIRGINDNSVSEIETGSQELSQGDTAFSQAGTDIQQAKCSSS